MTRTKGHFKAILLCGIVCALGLCLAASGRGFAGGTGESNDPYQIATAEQLIALDTAGQNAASTCCKLVADIDLGGVEWTHPVIASFAGTLDGNGHVIRNLHITGVGALGLFGALQSNARVSNLGLVDADILGTSSAGALAATSSGTVIDCYSTGSVTGMGNNVGGLVGVNSGTIAGSHSTADVIGDAYVGGVIGNNSGSVSECAGAGDVFGDSYVGGLTGYNTGYVSTSCSKAAVTGYTYVGGLIGRNYSGSVAVCYSTGSVNGSTHVGGLIGYHSGRLSSCYSAASLSSQGSTFGYLVGTTSTGSSSSITGCYYLLPAESSGASMGATGTALTASQMKQRPSFTSWDFWGTAEDGTADAWFLPPDAFPVLAWQTETTGLVVMPNVAGRAFDEVGDLLAQDGLAVGGVTVDYSRTLPVGNVITTYPRSFAQPGDAIDLVLSLSNTYDWTWNPGDGTVANPYQIQTPGQLESLGDSSGLWDKSFVLTADLDMAGRTYSTALIAPDVNTATDFQGTSFNGSFNGNEHILRNLRIVSDSPSADYLGLFGRIDTLGQVSGLSLEDVLMRDAATSSSHRAGALAGYNKGTVVDCSSTGVIATGCSGYVGGLLGTNAGSTTNCQTTVFVFRPGCSATRGS